MSPEIRLVLVDHDSELQIIINNDLREENDWFYIEIDGKGFTLDRQDWIEVLKFIKHNF